MSSDNKVMKTKNLPLDEIYLECGLRFKLWPLEPKKPVFGIFPYLRDPLLSLIVPGAAGGHFWGDANKKSIKTWS